MVHFPKTAEASTFVLGGSASVLECPASRPLFVCLLARLIDLSLLTLLLIPPRRQLVLLCSGCIRRIARAVINRRQSSEAAIHRNARRPDDIQRHRFAAMADPRNSSSYSVVPQLQYNTVSGVNGPLVIVENVCQLFHYLPWFQSLCCTAVASSGVYNVLVL